MHHQQTVLSEKIKNLKKNEVVLRIDFSENYVCKCSTEIQAMHFGASKVQLSLHTGVQYEVKNDEVSSQSFTSVSDCLDHASFAIWAHLKPILVKINENPKFDTIHVISDSPSGQYRNRFTMYLIPKILPKISPNIKNFTWNFTEAGHGKGPMDGVGGVLKKTADTHVLHGNDITSCDDFVEILTEKCPSVSLIKISKENIDEIKLISTKSAAAVPNITQLHQIKWEKKDPEKIYTRFLSCFCEKSCKHFSAGTGFSNLEIKKKNDSAKKVVRKVEAVKVTKQKNVTAEKMVRKVKAGKVSKKQVAVNNKVKAVKKNKKTVK